MKHHYWEAAHRPVPVPGRLWAGGILFLAALFDLLRGSAATGRGVLRCRCSFRPGVRWPSAACSWSSSWGSRAVFWRVWTTSKTAIIKWGAVRLSVAVIAGCVWWASCLFVLAVIGDAWPTFALGRPALLRASAADFLLERGRGRRAVGVMVYTGVMLSTLKAHAFWATPALPVLFTVSATLHGLRGHRAVASAAGAAALTLAWPVRAR